MAALNNTNLDHLAQVTRLSRGLAFKSPFEILPHLQQAKFVECHCAYAIPDFDLQPFELKSLTNLKLICHEANWSMAELKAAFTFFPNLTDLSLVISGVADNYDEQVPNGTIASFFLFCLYKWFPTWSTRPPGGRERFHNNDIVGRFVWKIFFVGGGDF